MIPPTFDLLSAQSAEPALGSSPDSLEDDQASADAIGRDLHDVYLANDPAGQK